MKRLRLIPELVGLVTAFLVPFLGGLLGRGDILVMMAALLLMLAGSMGRTRRREREIARQIGMEPFLGTDLRLHALLGAAFLVGLILCSRASEMSFEHGLLAGGLWLLYCGVGEILASRRSVARLCSGNVVAVIRRSYGGVTVRGRVGEDGVVAADDGSMVRVDWASVRWRANTRHDAPGSLVELVGVRFHDEPAPGRGMVPWFRLEPLHDQLPGRGVSPMNARLDPGMVFGCFAVILWCLALWQLVPDLLETIPRTFVEDCLDADYLCSELGCSRGPRFRVHGNPRARCRDRLYLAGGGGLAVVPWLWEHGEAFAAGYPGPGDWIEKRRFEVALHTSLGELPYKGKRNGALAILSVAFALMAWLGRRRNLWRSPAAVEPAAVWMSAFRRHLLEGVPVLVVAPCAAFLLGLAPPLYGIVVVMTVWWPLAAFYGLRVLRGPRLRRIVLRSAARTLARRPDGLDVTGELAGGVLVAPDGRRFAVAWTDACWPGGVVRTEDGTRLRVLGRSAGEQDDPAATKLEREPAVKLTRIEPCDRRPVLVDLPDP